MSCKRGRKIKAADGYVTRQWKNKQRRALGTGASRVRNGRARALVGRILRAAKRKGAQASTRACALSLLMYWCDPFGDETQPRRARERLRAMLNEVWSLTGYWRARRSVCGQCGERDPERPCGNPCNQCPF